MAVHKETRLHTEFDQEISISLTPEQDGVELTFKEAGDDEFPPALYLNKEVINALTQTLIEYHKQL